MATTVQVVENLTVGKFINIEGKRCEVEAISFSQAITKNQGLEELLEVMSDDLITRGVINKKDGQYYWSEDGEPLIAEEDFED